MNLPEDQLFLQMLLMNKIMNKKILKIIKRKGILVKIINNLFFYFYFLFNKFFFLKKKLILNNYLNFFLYFLFLNIFLFYIYLKYYLNI